MYTHSLSIMIPAQLPPADGSITVVPGFVDFHAEHNPERAWAMFPSPKSPSEASTLSFGEFAKATHRVAHHVRPNREGAEREVVAIFVHTDAVLYMPLLAGVMRAGIIVGHSNLYVHVLQVQLTTSSLQPLPMSPKLSAEAVANLMKKTSSHRIITQPAFASIVDAVKTQLASENYAVQVDDLIAIDKTFPTLKSGDTTSELSEGLYPQVGSEPAMDDIVMYIHSSGSTGLPKPIPLTRKIQLQWATSSMSILCLRMIYVILIEMIDLLWETRLRGVRWGSMILLTFHMTGLYMQWLHPLVSGQWVGVYAPQSPAPPTVPTADSALEVCRVTNCNAVCAVPTFVEVRASARVVLSVADNHAALGAIGGRRQVPRDVGKLGKVCSCFS